MAQHPTGSFMWPELPFAEWADTCATLHRYLQVVGKVRLAAAPWVNHSWHATFYVTARGLTTSLIQKDGAPFQLDFDLVDHALELRTPFRPAWKRALNGLPVAAFRERLIADLEAVGLGIVPSDFPNEIPDAKPFSMDREPRSYDQGAVECYLRALFSMMPVFERFRTGFVGKVSPVHLFWGSMDLAVTRFSGRPAPLHPGGIPALPDEVTREAYSHEVSSAGFWPGDPLHDASFYAYAYPEPPGFSEAHVDGPAYYDEDLGEFILPYAEVCRSEDPEGMLSTFLEQTYAATAELGAWDRALDRPAGEPGVCPRVSERGWTSDVRTTLH
jgi:hypothetical protein